jgi:hypothetical protein
MRSELADARRVPEADPPLRRSHRGLAYAFRSCETPSWGAVLVIRFRGAFIARPSPE